MSLALISVLQEDLAEARRERDEAVAAEGSGDGTEGRDA
jgi:hypothetical protein